MKLKEIFNYTNIKVFVVLDQTHENELEWLIEPTNFELIPEDENYYFIKAIVISKNKTSDCYIGIEIPERTFEVIIKKDFNGQTKLEYCSEQQEYIIPAVASECFGEYELFYARENPTVGIEILKDGILKAKNKNIVAEDLAYILRDEGLIEEAIEAFKLSEQNEPSSEFIYYELAELYKQIGRIDKFVEYEAKYRNNGGIDM